MSLVAESIAQIPISGKAEAILNEIPKILRRRLTTTKFSIFSLPVEVVSAVGSDSAHYSLRRQTLRKSQCTDHSPQSIEVPLRSQRQLGKCPSLCINQIHEISRKFQVWFWFRQGQQPEVGSETFTIRTVDCDHAAARSAAFSRHRAPHKL